MMPWLPAAYQRERRERLKSGELGLALIAVRVPALYKLWSLDLSFRTG
jgi:hypothetical protein